MLTFSLYSSDTYLLSCQALVFKIRGETLNKQSDFLHTKAWYWLHYPCLETSYSWLTEAQLPENHLILTCGYQIYSSNVLLQWSRPVIVRSLCLISHLAVAGLNIQPLTLDVLIFAKFKSLFASLPRKAFNSCHFSVLSLRTDRLS